MVLVDRLQMGVEIGTGEFGFIEAVVEHAFAAEAQRCRRRTDA